MTRVRPLLLAAALAVPVTIAEDADQQQQVTTVSVFVPGYRKENWDDLAGSVVTSVSFARSSIPYSSYVYVRCWPFYSQAGGL